MKNLSFPAFLFLSFLTAPVFAITDECLYSPREAQSAKVSGYLPGQWACEDSDGKIVQAIRAIRTSTNQNIYLTVDKNSLETSLVKASCLKCTKSELGESQYRKILQLGSNNKPHPLQNDGLTESVNKVSGPLLTVDLCPSSREFEQRLFEALTHTSLPRPIPVGLAITGKWMNANPQKMRYLTDLERSGEIKISWINHSHSHPYSSKRELKNNFLLSSGVDFKAEVLSVEVNLIENGLTPSVYFRFPGLVSSGPQIEMLQQWGLIALGSKAWLAKGEKPRNGSIILVHGNGNEAKGIDLFINKILAGLDFIVSFESAFGS